MPKVNKAVEKQAQRADELHQQLYGNTSNKAPDTEDPGTQNPPPTESDTTNGNADGSAPAVAPAPAANDATPENNSNAPKPKFPDADPNDPSWEQKYKVIANKYSAEIPRYAAEIRSLKQEIDSLKSQITQSASAPTSQPASAHIKPEEVEEYGEKFVDFVKRAAKEVVPNTDVDGLKQSVEEVRRESQKLSRQRFFDELGGLASQWTELNEDKGFLDWLGELDPYTGQQRQVLFDDAYSKLDAWRVANFFNAYSGGIAKQEPPPQKPSLEAQVVPKTSGRSAPPQGKKIYTTQEIARFYDGLRRGDFSADEAQRIEQDIFAAQAEGRLR